MFCKYICTMDTRRDIFKFAHTIQGNSNLKIEYVQNNFNKYHFSTNNILSKIRFKKKNVLRETNTVRWKILL